MVSAVFFRVGAQGATWSKQLFAKGFGIGNDVGCVFWVDFAWLGLDFFIALTRNEAQCVSQEL